jgi:hypothetical protein
VNFEAYSSRHVMRCVFEPVVGLPVESRAGLNFARLVRMRHVAESSALEPLELETLQFDMRPLTPIDSTTVTVPSSSASIADDG